MPTVVTKTIKPGGGGDYTTLAAWATARLGVALVDTVERAVCYAGNCGSVSFVTVGSMDATSYAEVVADAGSRHAGVWDEETRAYIKITTAASTAIVGPGSSGRKIFVTGMLIDGQKSATCAYQCGLKLRECICKNGVSAYDVVANCDAENVVAYSDVASYCRGFYSGISQQIAWSNCTAVGLTRGFHAGDGSGSKVTATNCIAQMCTDGFYTDFGWNPSSNYNVSDIAGDAPGTHSKTGVVQFVDAAAKDYHLSPADTVARGAGVNLTASGITTDIDGDARPATGAWDIGADQVVESPTPTPGEGRKPWGRDPWGRTAWGRAAWGRAG